MNRKQPLNLDPNIEEEIDKLAKGTDQERLEEPKDTINSVKINTVNLDLVIRHEDKKTKEGVKENEEPTEKGIGNGRNTDEPEKRSTTVSNQKRYTII